MQASIALLDEAKLLSFIESNLDRPIFVCASSKHSRQAAHTIAHKHNLRVVHVSYTPAIENALPMTLPFASMPLQKAIGALRAGEVQVVVSQLAYCLTGWRASIPRIAVTSTIPLTVVQEKQLVHRFYSVDRPDDAKFVIERRLEFTDEAPAQ